MTTDYQLQIAMSAQDNWLRNTLYQSCHRSVPLLAAKNPWHAEQTWWSVINTCARYTEGRSQRGRDSCAISLCVETNRALQIHPLNSKYYKHLIYINVGRPPCVYHKMIHFIPKSVMCAEQAQKMGHHSCHSNIKLTKPIIQLYFTTILNLGTA